MSMLFCPHCSMPLLGEVTVSADGLIKLRDGEVVLYKRGDSSQWQARFKTSDGKWHRISTKRSNLDEASNIATDAYDRARFLAKEGIIAVSRRFRDVGNLTIKNIEKAIEAGTGKVIYKDYVTAIRNHLIPFFGSKYIDKIGQEEINKFETWRTEKLGKIPAQSTIMTHNTALLRVFDTAVEEGWVKKQNVPALKNRGRKRQRRPAFTQEEWKHVTANLRHWVRKAPESDPRKRNMRELLWDYVLILANTGMRTGREANNLKWNQIRWQSDGNGDRFLVFSANGKTGKRDLIARHGCEEFLKRIQSRFTDLAEMKFDELLKAKRKEHVFRLRDGRQTINLNHTFQQFLEEYDLLYDQHGEKRSLYSLRHTYATLRLLNDNIDMHTLAKQMGTSIQMLEQHYSHISTIMKGQLLAGKKYEKGKNKET